MIDEIILREKAAKMLAKCDVISIASVTEDGYPRICTVSPLKTVGISEIYFSTGADSVKVRQFRENPKAGVCFHNMCNSQTLIGTVEIIDDMNIKAAVWQDWLSNYFKGGISDPDYCLVKFTAQTATLWVDGYFKTIKV